MRLIKTTLSVLWRIWFYLWMLIVIVFLSPVLLLTIWTEKTYPYFFKVARLWAKIIFFGMGMRYEVKQLQTLEKGRSYMFVANHTSMMDIMLMYILVKDNPFVFVGKKELARLPLFGFFYKKTCILVDRGSSKSRYEVFKRAQARLNQGLSICIFPEGGVPSDRNIILDNFKDGAFRLAIEHQIPVVPMSFGYLRYYFPFVWGKGFPGKVPVIVHPFVETEGRSQEDKKAVKDQVRSTILDQLNQWESHKKIRT